MISGLWGQRVNLLHHTAVFGRLSVLSIFLPASDNFFAAITSLALAHIYLITFAIPRAGEYVLKGKMGNERYFTPVRVIFRRSPPSLTAYTVSYILWLPLSLTFNEREN